MFKTIRKAVHSHRREEIDEDTPVTFPNDLGAGDKRFITTLAAELNLTLAWDEFDEDQNVVSLYFPPRRPPAPVLGSGDDEGESEDSSEDDEAIQESNAAIDRVLNRYMNAGAVEDGEEEFEKREVARLKEKMDEWKREYYKVSQMQLLLSRCEADAERRINWKYRMMTAQPSATSYIVGWKGSNGSCSTTTVALPLGAGSIIIIIHRV